MPVAMGNPRPCKVRKPMPRTEFVRACPVARSRLLQTAVKIKETNWPRLEKMEERKVLTKEYKLVEKGGTFSVLFKKC